MAQAKIRYNPDQSMLETVTPDGEEYGPLDYPDEDGDNLVYMLEDPGNMYVAVLEGGYENLKENTLYKLVEVSTLVETVDEFEAVDDDADDDPEPTPEG